jgi:hypothetical protein
VLTAFGDATEPEVGAGRPEVATRDVAALPSEAAAVVGDPAPAFENPTPVEYFKLFRDRCCDFLNIFSPKN